MGAAQARSPLDGAHRAARRLLGTTEPPPVRGRAAILLLFESLVERGSGALVLLGERGVGKTRLAVEGARIALARGAAVLTAVAGAHAAGAPYGVFADLFHEEARVSPSAPAPFAAEALDLAGRPEAVRLRIFTKPVVLDYRNDLWKFQPTSQLTPANASTVQPVTFPDTRTAAPEHVDGDLRIASFNVLNFFNETGQDYAAEGHTCTSFNDRTGEPSR